MLEERQSPLPCMLFKEQVYKDDTVMQANYNREFIDTLKKLLAQTQMEVLDTLK